MIKRLIAILVLFLTAATCIVVDGAIALSPGQLDKRLRLEAGRLIALPFDFESVRFSFSEGLTVENFDKFQNWYDNYDFWIVFTCGFTPLPYKVCTISAGVAEIYFIGFIIASTVSRSARFFLVAGLFWRFGPTIRPFIDKYFNWLCLIFMVLLIFFLE